MSNCNKKISQYPFYTGSTPSDLIFPVVDTSVYNNYNITYDELISDISSSFFSGGCIDLITVHNIDGCSPINILTDVYSESTITANTIDVEYGIVKQYIDFSATTAPTAVAGRLFYDQEKNALSYNPCTPNLDVTLNIGQEELIRVYNQSGQDIKNGQFCYIDGTAPNGLPSIQLADASSFNAAAFTSGVATHDITNNHAGFITSFGVVRDIVVTGATAGSQVFLSDTEPGGYIFNINDLKITSRISSIGRVLTTGVTGSILVNNIQNEELQLPITNKQQNLFIGETMSNGVFEFSGITITSPTTFDLSLIKGWIVDNTNENILHPIVHYIDYSGETGITSPYLLTDFVTYLLITTGATLTLTNHFPTAEERRDNIALGGIFHPEGQMLLALPQPDYSTSPLSQLRDMFSPIRFINDGVIISASGSSLSINSSYGTIWGLGINWLVDQKSPNNVTVAAQTPTVFQYRTQTGGTFTDIYYIDPLNYDVAGIITPLVSGATNQRIYYTPYAGFRIQYGQTVYPDLNDAVFGVLTEPFVLYEPLDRNAILVGVLSVESTCTDLSDGNKAQFHFVSKFGELGGGGAGGLSTTTLQQAYNNSSSPEIITNSILDGVQFQSGTGSDTDSVIIIQNNAGTPTAWIMANGGAIFTTLGSTGNCVNELYVSDVYGCSPVTLHTGFNSPNSLSVNDTSFAFGENAVATGNTSFAFGYNVRAEGDYSHAEGYTTIASGYASHAEGSYTTASGAYSHAGGYKTVASGTTSYAEGYQTVAGGNYSHAEGSNTRAYGIRSHAEGANAIATGQNSHAEGSNTIAIGKASHAEGSITTTSGNNSHAEGQSTTASGDSAHAEGASTIASGPYTHSEGYQTIASGNGSHAEGYVTTASGYVSHAEGDHVMAIGMYSHGEGNNTIASGNYSHAGGRGRTLSNVVVASGISSFNHSTTTGGNTSYALGNYSAILGGVNNNVYGERSVVLGGQYNRANGINSVIIGGAGIIGNNNDTVYVPYLNIASATTNNQINAVLVRQSDGTIITRDSDTLFTGNTLATCINDIYVHNLAGCSPINVLTDIIVNENITVNKNATILGNVTILGTATTLNTETLLVKDNIITLNSTFTAGTPTLNSGIEILRGDEQSAQLLWNENTDVWELGYSGNMSTVITNVSGTTNYIPKFNSSSSVANSIIYDDGTKVGIGTAVPNQQLEITKNFRFPFTTYNSGNNYGVIYKDGYRFIHDFNYGNNGIVTTEGYNIFIGINSGNFTMGSSVTTPSHASYNTALGFVTLVNNDTGGSNTAIGSYALSNNSSGFTNTAVGVWSLYGNINGSYNTAIGDESGYYIYDGVNSNTTSDYCTFLGGRTKVKADGDQNSIVIGYNAVGLGTNTVVLGNSSITTTRLQGNVGIGTDNPNTNLTVVGGADISGTTSGSTVFNVYGTSGELFSVTDTLSGDLLSVIDTYGDPIFTVDSNNNVTVDGILNINSFVYTNLSASTVVASFDKTYGNAAYFDYYIKNATNSMRSGTIMSVWDGTNVEYTDVATNDLNGSTSNVEFSMAIVGSNVQLSSIISGGTWTIKTGIRII